MKIQADVFQFLGLQFRSFDGTVHTLRKLV